MAHARQAVELDVVLGREALERALHAAAQLGGGFEGGVEFGDRTARSLDQLAHQRIALGVRAGIAALVDFGQAVLQRVDQ
ncbi:hypothetical protein D3C86_2053840 [compost metagenome]